MRTKKEIIENLKVMQRRKNYYFVSVDGAILFESESITECKKYLAKVVKQDINEIVNGEKELYNYFIGMYSNCIA